MRNPSAYPESKISDIKLLFFSSCFWLIFIMDCWEFLLKYNCVVFILGNSTWISPSLLLSDYSFLITPSFLPLRPSQLFHSLLSILCLNNLLIWDTVAKWLTLFVEKQNSKSLPCDSNKSNYLWTPRRQKTRPVLPLNPSSCQKWGKRKRRRDSMNR